MRRRARTQPSLACRRTLSERGAGAAGLGTRVVPDERALRAARGAQRGGAVGGLGRRMVARQSEVRHCLSPPSDREAYAPYSMLIRYMCTACAWEASGAVSGKFREISAPAAPLANFSLNFAKLWPTPIELLLSAPCLRADARDMNVRGWRCWPSLASPLGTGAFLVP